VPDDDILAWLPEQTGATGQVPGRRKVIDKWALGSPRADRLRRIVHAEAARSATYASAAPPAPGNDPDLVATDPTGRCGASFCVRTLRLVGAFRREHGVVGRPAGASVFVCDDIVRMLQPVSWPARSAPHQAAPGAAPARPPRRRTQRAVAAGERYRGPKTTGRELGAGEGRVWRAARGALGR
jgi:hypothetical protein